MADILKRYGFEISLLLDPKIPDIRRAFESIRSKAKANDLVLFYYGGMSFKSHDAQIAGENQLVLPTADVDFKLGLDNFTLRQALNEMNAIVARDKILLIDGCHGTFGVSPGTDGAGASAEKPLVQIFAASQDDQLSFEDSSLGGGVFTQSLIQVLSAALDRAGGIGMSQLAADVTRTVQKHSMARGRSVPKLVTVAGAGEIVFKPDHELAP
jgi:uncharacterized caspase-like protein